MINKYNHNNLIEKYFLNLSENINAKKKVFHNSYYSHKTNNNNNNANQQLITELSNEKEKNKNLNE